MLNRSAFLSGRYQEAFDEIVAAKDACGAAHLKTILETGELGTYDQIRRASVLAMAAGSDFIKTSTGKISPAATLPTALCMAEAIRDFRRDTGAVVGSEARRRHPHREGRLAVPRRRARDPRVRSG